MPKKPPPFNDKVCPTRDNVIVVYAGRDAWLGVPDQSRRHWPNYLVAEPGRLPSQFNWEFVAGVNVRVEVHGGFTDWDRQMLARALLAEHAARVTFTDTGEALWPLVQRRVR